jgi:hypothetical protein
MFPIPAPNANRKFLDFKVTITKPDTTQEVVTVNSYVADGTQWFEWVADEVGEWKFKFEMPGQYFPAGRYLDGNIITATTGGTVYTDSVYYQPSSTPERTLTVQQDFVASWPPAPLPTDYWTRPVPYEKREWWPISGAFPWHGTTTHDLALWNQYYPDTNPYWGGRDYAGGAFGPWRGTSPHGARPQQSTCCMETAVCHCRRTRDWETESGANIFGSGVGRFPKSCMWKARNIQTGKWYDRANLLAVLTHALESCSGNDH